MNNFLTTLSKLAITMSLLIVGLLHAQVPQGFSYQAVARDANGDCLADTMITLQFAILDDVSSGIELYREEFGSVMTNKNGLFSLVIGQGSPESPWTQQDFANIDWTAETETYALEVLMSTNNNSNDLLLVGTVPLMSVPYALGAEKAIYSDSAVHAILADEAIVADEAIHAETAGQADHADSSLYATQAGNGLQTSSGGDEFLFWNGPNGSTNGELTTASTSFLNNGAIRLYDDSGDRLVTLFASKNGTTQEDVGALVLYGDNGNQNINASWSGDLNHGAMTFRDPNGDVKVTVQSEDIYNGAGRVSLFGPNGTSNVDLSITSATTTDGDNKGAIRLRDENGATRSTSGINTFGSGYFLLQGPNSQTNVILTNDTNPNHGYMAVRDASGTTRARLTINNLGNGVLEVTGPTGGIKNFVMPHPTRLDKEIAYVCIEGPEAAAYERGTAELVNGEAEVHFSEHFEIVANPATMTVLTSPWSADAKGLAIIERTATGFKVKELGGGTGSYKFDWEAKAVRKGWEDYEVIRDKMEDPGADVEVEK